MARNPRPTPTPDGRPLKPGIPDPYKNRAAFDTYTNYIYTQRALNPKNPPVYNEDAWRGFVDDSNKAAQAAAAARMPAGFSSGGGGGGGGGGRGRGGGGGGGSAAPTMSQALFDQMLKLLGGGMPSQLKLQQAQLPAFRGQNIAAFNPAVYNQARQQLARAVAADQAATNQNAAQTEQALRSNFTNSYENVPVQSGYEAPQGQALAATVGTGTGDQAGQNAALAGDSQAAFQNLLGVLAANAQQSQASRLNQVALDRNTALRNIGTQNTALTGQIGMGQQQAYQNWLQRDEERRMQNAMLQQQWQREALMRNQDLTNQAAQSNWQARNEAVTSRIQPLIDLLMNTMGTQVKTDGLSQLLAQLGR